MNYTEFQNKEVVTRKSHWCEWCGEPIEKGSRVPYRAYMCDREFVSAWMHPECREAMHNSDRSIQEDGWYPGEQERGQVWRDV